MTGSSIFDYVHHQDHAEIAEQLGLGLASNTSMASPSSGISEDGGANQGTNNPDGNFDYLFKTIFVIGIPFNFVFFLFQIHCSCIGDDGKLTKLVQRI